MQSKITSYEDIAQLLAKFKAISLPEMDSVNLLNRTEKKFIMHVSKIEAVLLLALADYRVLEINASRLLEYSTEYFDTFDNVMYLAHHNGRQNRFKVRKREYLISGEQFLEVKRRYNNGRTQKKRVELNGSATDGVYGQVLVEAATPYKLNGLEKKLENTFHRITLVNDACLERITIDLGLSFRNDKGSINLPSVSIIEIKKEKAGPVTGFELIMHKLGIHGSSVSKYCIGRALLEPTLKANLFQNKIRYLTKLNAIVHDHSFKP